MKNEKVNTELREWVEGLNNLPVTEEEKESIISEVNNLISGNHPSTMFYLYGYIKNWEEKMNEYSRKEEEKQEIVNKKISGISRKAKKEVEEYARKYRIAEYVNDMYRNSFRFAVPAIKNITSVIREHIDLEKAWGTINNRIAINKIEEVFQSFVNESNFLADSDNIVKAAINEFVSQINDLRWNNDFKGQQDYIKEVHSLLYKMVRYMIQWNNTGINDNPFLSGIEQDIKENTTPAGFPQITEQDFLPNLDEPEKQQAPSIDLQLFAGGFTQQAPSHILYAQETEEYIIRSFFDRPGHNCKNGYPSYVRQSGKNQGFSYIAGPFWSKGSARDILDLADYLLFLLNHWEEDLLRVSFNCNEKGNCNSYEVTCGKEHDASCKGGKMEKIWKSCIRHDSMMKKLKDVLEAKGIALYKDWAEFGTSRQKMVWWIER